MPLHNLTRFPRLEFIGAPTPLEYLPRFSDYLGREIFIKRDDVTPMAMGGNKLRKLEFLAADALREGADTLITAGAPDCRSCGETRSALRGAAGKSNWHNRRKLFNQRQSFVAGSVQYPD